MKEILTRLNNGRVTVPLEFRKKIGIKREDNVIVLRYDEEKNILSIAPCMDDGKVTCQVTGEQIELAEAIPINKDEGLYISRKALLRLMDIHIVSKNKK